MEEFNAEKFELRGKVLVEASAGSGKTYSLVVVYMRLLIEKRLTPKQIVILTYTRKAATEISERIHQQLEQTIFMFRAQLERLDVDFDKIETATIPVPMSELTPEASVNAFTRIVEQTCHELKQNRTAIKTLVHELEEAQLTLEKSSIGTFHSFLHTLFQTFAYTTGVPTQIRVTEENIFLDEVLNNFLREIFYNTKYNPYHGYFAIRGMDLEYFKKVLSNFWKRSEARPLETQNTLPEPTYYAQLKTNYQTNYKQLIIAYEAVLDVYPILKEWKLLPAYSTLEHQFSKRNRISKKSYSFLSGVSETIRGICQSSELEVQMGFMVNLTSGLWGTKAALSNLFEAWRQTSNIEADIQERLGLALRGRTRVLGSDGKDIEPFFEQLVQYYFDYLHGVGKLYLFYEQVHQYFLCRVLTETRKLVPIKRLSAGIMTYEDLITWALERYSENFSADTDTVGTLLGQTYDAVMIDEFQDTNSKLYEMVKTYFAQVKLMLFIGDPKQSIFSFQGADINAYIRMREYIQTLPEGRLYTLNVNYRSHPQLLAALNALYQTMDCADDPFLSSGKLEYKPMRSGRKEGEEVVASRLTLWCFKDIAKKKADRQSQIANLIIRELQREQQIFQETRKDLEGIKLEKQAFWSRFAILVSKNESGEDFEQLLRNANIPVRFMRSGHKQEAIEFKTTAGKDIYYFLKAIFNSQTLEPRRHALTLPFFACDYPYYTILGASVHSLATLFDPLKEQWAREGLFPMIEAFLETPLKPFYGETEVITGAEAMTLGIKEDYSKSAVRQTPETHSFHQTQTSLAPQSSQFLRSPLVNILTHFSDPDIGFLYIRELRELNDVLAEVATKFSPHSEVKILDILAGVLEGQSLSTLGTDYPELSSNSVLANLGERLKTVQQTPSFREYEWFKHATPNNETLASAEHLQHAQSTQFKENVVRIYTIFSSKGLEFDTVFLPTLMDTDFKIPSKKHLLYAPFALAQDQDTQEKWVIDLHGRMLRDEIVTQHESERRRLLYVALTRARERLVAVVYADSKAEQKEFNTHLGTRDISCAFTQLLNWNPKHVIHTETDTRKWFPHLPETLVTTCDATNLSDSAETDESTEPVLSSLNKLKVATTSIQSPATELIPFKELLPQRSLRSFIPVKRFGGGYVSSFTALLRKSFIHREAFTHFSRPQLEAYFRAELADDVFAGSPLKSLSEEAEYSQLEEIASLEAVLDENSASLEDATVSESIKQEDNWVETLLNESELTDVLKIRKSEEALLQQETTLIETNKHVIQGQTPPASTEHLTSTHLFSEEQISNERPNVEVEVNLHDRTKTKLTTSFQISDEDLRSIARRLPSERELGTEVGNFMHALLDDIDFNLTEVASMNLFREKLQSLLEIYSFLKPYQFDIEKLILHLLAVPFPLSQPSLARNPSNLESVQMCALQNIPKSHCMFEMEFLLPTTLQERVLGTKLTQILYPSTKQTLSVERKESKKSDPQKKDIFGQSQTSSAWMYSSRLNEELASSQAYKNYFSLETGFMRGFIDLFFKYEERYYLLDWKTNNLMKNIPEALEPYSLEHLQHVMDVNGYTFQYHIYLVALHRHLKRTLGSQYDYAIHFGGVLYVFIRGVNSEMTRGVFMKRPEETTLTELDALFTPPPSDKEELIGLS